ncbi:MAG: hypothetical protein NT157_01400 [Candidatus Micrarchaeota archaeon]|nr:hypothetical protein [Candidatus Micrarchaeota archaeon]
MNETNCKFIAKTLANKGKTLALLLPKYGGLAGKELCENRRYGTELSDYAKALAGVGGIIHSGEKMEKYSISESEVAGVRKLLGAGDWDAFAIVADEEGKARRALDAVYARALVLEVPEETRRALADGGSEFMRPLPGKARLYPETDVTPVRITRERVERIRSNLPKTFEERRGELEGKLSEDLREKILKSKYLQLFERIVGELGIEPKIVAGTLEDAMKSLRRDGVNVDSIGEEGVYEMFKLYSKNVFVKAAIPEIIKGMAGGASASEAVTKLGLKKMGAAELKKAIKEEKSDFGSIMRKYRLRAEAEDVKKTMGQ